MRGSGFSTFVSFQNLWTSCRKLVCFRTKAHGFLNKVGDVGRKWEKAKRKGATITGKEARVARDVKKQQGKENKQSLPVADFVNIEMGEFLGKEGG
jgi:lipoprotein